MTRRDVITLGVAVLVVMIALCVVGVVCTKYVHLMPWSPDRPIPSTDTSDTEYPVYCTQEAKQCPNGSYVGRTGPDCEFAACPKK